MPTLTNLETPQAAEDSPGTVASAVALLAPRWALPEPLVTVALADMADDLGVDLGSLAALVVHTSPV